MLYLRRVRTRAPSRAAEGDAKQSSSNKKKPRPLHPHCSIPATSNPQIPHLRQGPRERRLRPGRLAPLDVELAHVQMGGAARGVQRQGLGQVALRLRVVTHLCVVVVVVVCVVVEEARGRRRRPLRCLWGQKGGERAWGFMGSVHTHTHAIICPHIHNRFRPPL